MQGTMMPSEQEYLLVEFLHFVNKSIPLPSKKNFPKAGQNKESPANSGSSPAMTNKESQLATTDSSTDESSRPTKASEIRRFRKNLLHNTSFYQELEILAPLESPVSLELCRLALQNTAFVREYDFRKHASKGGEISELLSNIASSFNFKPHSKYSRPQTLMELNKARFERLPWAPKLQNKRKRLSREERQEKKEKLQKRLKKILRYDSFNRDTGNPMNWDQLSSNSI